MKELKLMIASMVLTCFASFPVASLADDDLDVTMEILDNLAQIEGVVLQMTDPDDNDKGADGGGDEGDDYEDDGAGDDDHEDRFEHDGEEDGDDHEDGFEHDDEGETDADLEPGENHDEGDDVDTDEFDDE